MTFCSFKVSKRTLKFIDIEGLKFSEVIFIILQNLFKLKNTLFHCGYTHSQHYNKITGTFHTLDTHSTIY